MSRQEEIRDKVASGLFQDDITSLGAPFITEDTYRRVSESLNLAVDPMGFTGPIDYYTNHPTNRINQRTSDYFKFLHHQDQLTGAGGLHYQINNWLNASFGQNPQYPMLADMKSNGLSLVITAFHTQCEGNFLDRLANLPPKELMFVFDADNPGSRNRMSIIGRTMDNHQIPESQIFLNALVNQYITNFVPQPYELLVEDGAITMFQIIDKFWNPYLASPNPTSTA